MTDIELVRTLTGNNDIDDAFISFYLESSANFIKSYCNISEVPEGLKGVYIEIAALKVKANAKGASSTLGEGVKAVGSVSDGNQSISYVTGGAGVKSFVSDEDFVAAYGSILGRYRKMVTHSPSIQKTLGSRCIHDNTAR